MKKKAQPSDGMERTVFWLHVIFVFVAWTGPFLFYWPYMVAGFIIVQFQFYFFNACLMNKVHDLVEEDDTTFYSYLFESWGLQPNKKKLKFFVRQILHVALAVFTLFWQVYLGNEPIIF